MRAQNVQNFYFAAKDNAAHFEPLEPGSLLGVAGCEGYEIFNGFIEWHREQLAEETEAQRQTTFLKFVCDSVKGSTFKNFLNDVNKYRKQVAKWLNPINPDNNKDEDEDKQQTFLTYILTRVRAKEAKIFLKYYEILNLNVEMFGIVKTIHGESFKTLFDVLKYVCEFSEEVEPGDDIGESFDALNYYVYRLEELGELLEQINSLSVCGLLNYYIKQDYKNLNDCLGPLMLSADVEFMKTLREPNTEHATKLLTALEHAILTACQVNENVKFYQDSEIFNIIKKLNEYITEQDAADAVEVCNMIKKFIIENYDVNDVNEIVFEFDI